MLDICVDDAGVHFYANFYSSAKRSRAVRKRSINNALDDVFAFVSGIKPDLPGIALSKNFEQITSTLFPILALVKQMCLLSSGKPGLMILDKTYCLQCAL